MIVIMSKDEYDKRLHSEAVYAASLVFIKDGGTYIKAKDRLEGCGDKADRYSEHDVMCNTEKHVQLYTDEAYFKSKEKYDTNE